MKNVVIAGATGAVGNEFLKLLEAREFPVKNLRLLASARSIGKKLEFRGEKIPVEQLTSKSFSGVDLAFFSAGRESSKVYIPHAVESGTVVIDNSSAFRMEPDVPLVVPEINPESAFKHKGIIANPNCSTIQMVVALNPLHKAAEVKRVVVSTYQSTAGAGAKGMNELLNQTRAWANGEALEVSSFPSQILFNLFPHVDIFMENGYTKEEMKMLWETQKIMGDQSILVNATAVRVPVFYGHAEAIHLETRSPIDAQHVKELLADAPGVTVYDGNEQFPTQVSSASGNDIVHVGRIRNDITHPCGLNLWVVSDNIRKGAATNSIQIAETLIRDYL